MGPRRSQIPRPSSSQSDLGLKDLLRSRPDTDLDKLKSDLEYSDIMNKFRSRPDIDLDKLKSDLEYSDIMNKLRSRPDFDVDKLLDELRSQEPVSTSSVSAQDEEQFPMPKIKQLSNKTFSERPFQTQFSSMPNKRIKRSI